MQRHLIAVILLASLAACAAPQSVAVPDVPYPGERLPIVPEEEPAAAAHAAPYVPFQVAEPRKIGKRDRACLVAAIYYEANGEGEKGMEAVGNVVLNRLDERPDGTTICDVVYERGQFGWTRRVSRKKLAIGRNPRWKGAIRVADRLIAGHVRDRTGGATSFYSVIEFPDGPPRWVDVDKETVQIGNHVFVGP